MPPVETFSLFSIVTLGFSLGMRHATDPDHVVAVATIVSRERSLRGAALLGSLWGVGHTLTIVVVGGAIVLFGIVIPERIGLGLELGVAMMLVLLGVLNVSGAARDARAIASRHEHVEGAGHASGEGEGHHAHGEGEGHHHDEGHHAHGEGHRAHGEGHHAHGEGHHAHAGGALARLDRRLGHIGAYKLVRPLVIGVVHGLAGSAAIALLVLGTLRDPGWAIAYLLVFGAGTIAGMMLITTALAVPFAYSAGRFARVNRWLGLASGLLSVAFGAFLVYRIGFVDGLFAAQPR